MRVQRATCVLSLAVVLATSWKQGHGAGAGSSPVSMAVRQNTYEDLVGAIRAYHVFTDQTEKNLDYRWEEQLPRLRKEFMAATSRDELLRAIHHLANSLHNPHCGFEPPGRSVPLSAGFDVAVAWAGGAPTFYVASVDRQALRAKLTVGDVVAGVDGVEAKDFVATFFNRSTANNRRSLVDGVSRFLTHRKMPVASKQIGDTSQWVFASRTQGQRKEVEIAWHHARSRHRSSRPTGFGVQGCAGLPERNYGPYRLDFRGARLCIYASDKEPFARYPVVRFFSFLYPGRYDWHLLRLDYQSLKDYFGGNRGLKGLVLDLRDNGGGRNPNWFLDWLAPAPYRDHLVHTRLHQDFADEGRLRDARITGWDPGKKVNYLQALKARKPGQDYTEGQAFFCPASGCEGWDHVYRPKHQVTRLPMALLIGPRCVSSCDHLAQVFSEYGFGPLVGQPTAGGFTAYRLRYRVRSGEPGLDLGFVYLAFSYEVSGKTGRQVEAVPVVPEIQVARTLENYDHYDALLVSKAVEALANP